MKPCSLTHTHARTWKRCEEFALAGGRLQGEDLATSELLTAKLPEISLSLSQSQQKLLHTYPHNVISRLTWV